MKSFNGSMGGICIFGQFLFVLPGVSLGTNFFMFPFQDLCCIKMSYMNENDVKSGGAASSVIGFI